MLKLALIFFGSGLGAIARHKLGGFVLHASLDSKFPFGTFLAIVLGCFVAGILAAAVERHNLFSTDTRLFLFTGLLGGFTTFSAFSQETVFLLRRGDVAIAAGYVALSVLCGLGALWLGTNLLPYRSL